MFDWRRSQRIALEAERPVVVMGRGHSGTRVLAWALEALGVRMGTLEAKPTGDVQDRRFTRAIKRLAERSLARPALAEAPPGELRRFRRAAASYLDWLGERGDHWGWKFPETYLIGPVVDAVFPKARYIHMVRDGRDLAFKEHLTDDSGRRLGRTLLERLDVLDAPHFLQAAHSWDFQVGRFCEFERERLGARCHRLHFEALCREPLPTMQAVADFLGVEMTAACRDYVEANLRADKLAQHRGEDPEQVAQVEAIIAPTLRACGYEADAR